MGNIVFIVFLALSHSFLPVAHSLTQLSECGDLTPPDNNIIKGADQMTNDEIFCIPDEIELPSNPSVRAARTEFYIGTENIASVSVSLKAEISNPQSCVGTSTTDGTKVVRLVRSELDTTMNEEATLAVGGKTLSLQFGYKSRMLHRVGQRPLPNKYSVDELPLRYVAFYFDRISSTTTSVCEKGNKLDLFILTNQVKVTACKTFTPSDPLLFQETILETNNNPFSDRSSINITVVSEGDCPSVDINTEEQITITDGPGTPPSMTSTTTPEPSSSPTTTDTSGPPDTLSGGVIVGIIIAVIVLGIGIAASIILAIVILRKWWKNKQKKKDQVEMVSVHSEHTPDTSPVHQQQLHQRKQQPRIYVWHTCPELGEEVADLLGNEQITNCEDVMKLTSLIHSDICRTFYLIHSGGRDMLKTTNPTAWKLIRDFETRPFDKKILQKFVVLRIYEREERNKSSDMFLGSILTINIALSDWQGDAKERAKIIRSRVKLNRDETDGLGQSQTPSQTDSPPRAPGPLQTSVELHTDTTHSPPQPQTVEMAQLDNQLPPYHSSPPSLKQPPPLSQPIPPTQSDAPQQQQQTGPLSGPKVIQLLERLVEHTGITAVASQQTANNTRNISEVGQETHDMVGEMYEHTVISQPDALENT